MKGVSGIISAILLIVIMISAISVMTYMMDTAYEQQQVVQKDMNDFVSSPKAFQVGSSSVTSDGPLEVKYVIYPNGQVKNLSQPFDGMTDLSGLLNGNPWVYVVLSNGQTFNITQPLSSTNSVSSNISLLSSDLSLLSLESQVPYYADYPLIVWNTSTYHLIMTKGLRVNPTDIPFQNGGTIAWNAFGNGTVAVIPVHTGNGWLNFSVMEPTVYFNCWYGLGIMMQNSTNGTRQWLVMAIEINWLGYYYIGTEYFGYPIEIGYGIQELPTSYWYWFYHPGGTTLFPTSTSTYLILSKGENVTFKVAIHFQEGQPAELYMWALDGSQWVPLHSYYGIYVAPINLVPGSNVIIVPDSREGTFVYNVTPTI
jgi:hypothetical protein